MPTLKLRLDEDVSTKTKKAKTSWSEFVTGLNQGFQLIRDVGGKAFQVLDDAFETAGKSEQLRSGFVSLSGGAAQAEANLQAVVGALRGTVSEMEAMEIANTALSFGIVESSDQLGELTEIGAVLAQSLGQDASKGVADLTLALSRNSPMILDNLGISLKLSASYEAQAKALGKTTSQLTEAEKSQAFLNEALRIGREKVEELGGFVESGATDWQRMKANTEDAKEKLAVFTAEAAEPLVGVLAEMSGNFDAVLEVMEGIGPVLDLLDERASGFNETMLGLNESIGPFGDWLSTAGEFWGDVVDNAVEGYREMARGAEAMEEGLAGNMAIVREVNAALGTSFAETEEGFRQATLAAKANREEMQAHREETKSGGLALHEHNLEKQKQIALAEEAAAAEKAAAEQMTAAMTMFGLSVEDTTEGQEELKRRGKEAFDLLRASGKFTAAQLDAAYADFFGNVQSGMQETTDVVVGENLTLINELSEAFGPDLFTSEDVAIAAWIDREKQELLDRKAELEEPIADAIESGIEAGAESTDLTGFAERLYTATRMSVAEAMSDPELAQDLAAALGIAIDRSLQSTEFALGDVDDLGAREQDKLKKLLHTTNGKVAQSLQGVLNAVEAGDLAFIAQAISGAQSNEEFASRYGNKVKNQDFRLEQAQILNGIREILDIFGIEIPGYSGGGVSDFRSGSLAMLHGREAVFPLEGEGGRQARQALGVEGLAPLLERLVALSERSLRLEEETLPMIGEATMTTAKGSGGGLASLSEATVASRSRARMYDGVG